MDKFDLITLSGLLLIAFGAYLIFEPLAPIVIGIGFMLFGLAGSRAGAK